MPSPFPGMDPYLEQPRSWSQFHNQLIIDIQRFLTPLLRPKYIVDTDITTYLTLVSSNGQEESDQIGRPDHLILGPTRQASPSSPAASPAAAVATRSTIEPIVTQLPIPEKVKHLYLKIRSREDDEVITVIELLSPANKQGSNRKNYEKKRGKFLNSDTSLVEIDLLRGGKPMPLNLELSNDYRIMVRRRWIWDKAWVYLFSIRDAIPDIPIPLSRDEEEPMLPLNDILHSVYDIAGFDLKIDYTRALRPSPTQEDEVWIEQIKQRLQNNVE